MEKNPVIKIFNILISPFKFIVFNFINGFIVVSYWFYKIVVLPFKITNKVVTIAEKTYDNKITVKEYNKQKEKINLDIKNTQKKNKKEIEIAKRIAKRRIKEEKERKRLEEIAIRNKEIEEKRQNLLIEKEKRKIEKQKEKVNRKSKADIKLEKRLAKQKKIEKSKLDKLNLKKQREVDKQEKKKQKLLLKIEERTQRIINKEQVEKDKTLGIIDKKIMLVTSQINDINNHLKDEQLDEKTKGTLAIKRGKLEEELVNLKSKRKLTEDKITKKYEKMREKDKLKSEKEKERIEFLFNKEALRLKKEAEQEKKFIDKVNKKNVVKEDISRQTITSKVEEINEKEEPKEELGFFQKMIKNSFIGKYIDEKREISRQALLKNFDNDDIKSNVKIIYEYVAKNPEGKVIKDYFEAFSKVEVHSYLISEGYTVYSIRTNKWIQLLHAHDGKTSNVKIKISDVIFMCTQLSTYIKAGIPLVEAIRILSKQYRKKSYQRVFSALMYDLTMGDNFSDALYKQGKAFPRLLINMVKASELTGELPETLDDMADYYTNTEATRKQMITAMTYPIIVTVIAVGVMIFIMMYVIPKFVDIYNSMEGMEIPAFTVAIINFSDWLKQNIVYLILGITTAVFLLIYLYKHVKAIRTSMQYFAMRLPVFGNVIIYNEVTMFTKTFASLLKHNVFITDSMEILNKISNNEVFKSLIDDTITNLGKGEKISEAFKDQWAFPIAAYEMIVTGEKTGQLAEMMDKVSSYYQELHRNSVARIKTFIEPIMIIGLTIATGVIVLAVIIPMFNMYSSISSLGAATE